jgi:hypothetical protein
MANKTNKEPTKRLPKSKRAHVRKMKQAARLAGVIYKPGS